MLDEVIKVVGEKRTQLVKAYVELAWDIVGEAVSTAIQEVCGDRKQMAKDAE